MYRNHNRKLEISTALTKRKSREPVYSQALVQNKIERQRIRESERQSDGYGGRCLELRRGGIVQVRMLDYRLFMRHIHVCVNARINVLSNVFACLCIQAYVNNKLAKFFREEKVSSGAFSRQKPCMYVFICQYMCVMLRMHFCF